MSHNLMKDLKFGKVKKYIRENGLTKNQRRLLDASLRSKGKNRKTRMLIIWTMEMAAAGFKYAIEKEIDSHVNMMFEPRIISGMNPNPINPELN